MSPCDVPRCGRPATEARRDDTRRAPERLRFCLMHARQFDRVQDRALPQIAIGFDPDDTATDVDQISSQLRQLEAREEQLLKEQDAIRIAIRQLRRARRDLGAV